MNATAVKCMALGLVLVLFSGCVVYEEHVTLDDKGGVVADVFIHRQALAQASPEMAEPFVLKAMLGRSCPPNVDLAIEKAGENVHFRFSSKKRDDLLEWARHKQNPLGNASVQLADGYMDVTRTIGLSNEFAWKSGAGAKMIFKLSAPGTLVSSNATRQEGDTAVWELDPNEVLSGKSTAFTARFKVSTPWVTYLLIVMMVAVVAAFFFVLKRKRKA